MTFPNVAGLNNIDELLTAELTAAGIGVIDAEIFRNESSEVSTPIRGELHMWEFKRAWYYWICKGPGIEVEAAEKLHIAHGRSVRVDGHCGCPSPREWFKGLACGSYHVDNAEGLKALADTIRSLVLTQEQTND